MKKADLKTGMVVETEEGDKYLVMINFLGDDDKILNINQQGYLNLEDYSEDLTVIERGFSAHNIVKVFVKKDKTLCLGGSIDCVCEWERSPKEPEYTMKELTNKIGHGFKIKQ